jgi:carbamoyltransferase
MKLLAFSYGTHCSGITLFENGIPLCCYEEERFARVKSSTDFDKNYFRYPTYSLKELKYKNNLDFNSVDYFLFPQNPTELNYSDFFIKNILSQYVDSHIVYEKIKFYDHHDAHCALAYYTSGFVDDKCLVVSMDGSGDAYSAKYYFAENNKMNYIDGIGVDHVSLGIFYCLLTEFLGFKRLKDEGKVVGMASHGFFDEEVYNIFNKVIGDVDGVKTKLMSGKKYFGSMFSEFYNLFYNFIGDVYYKDKQNLCNYAYTGQYIFEEKILQILNNLHALYPNYKKLCLSGGVFANVKLNKKNK